MCTRLERFENNFLSKVQNEKIKGTRTLLKRTRQRNRLIKHEAYTAAVIRTVWCLAQEQRNRPAKQWNPEANYAYRTPVCRERGRCSTMEEIIFLINCVGPVGFLYKTNTM